jgi:Lon protease-like protein
METEIVIPEELAVMTLPNIAFFPQALMPLHIFEPRYRQMLKTALASHRIFAVTGLRPDADPSDEQGQRIATAGIIRACNLNPDGTSNLLLQGLARVEEEFTVRETPYRIIRIKTLSSTAGAPDEENRKLRRRLERLISLKRQLGGAIPNGFTQFLRTIEDPEAFVDLAAFTLCENSHFKQRLLETLDVHERLTLYTESLKADIHTMTLQKKLQGRLPDDDIENN